MLSEKIELIGKGLYTDIPDTLTLKSIPTASELDYVGAEDFDAIMLDKILPQSVEEKINFRNLLEIDYQWVLRGLRMLNYGPYYTVNRVFCDSCREISDGEYRVDLRTISINGLPEGFTNEIIISKDEFIEYPNDITIKLLTIQDRINSESDKLFIKDGKRNSELARMCYMIKQIKGKDVKVMEAKSTIESKMIDADYKILRGKTNELTRYGLSVMGSCTCPKCGSTHATYLAFVDERFFRPSMGDLKAWKADKAS